MTSWLHLSRRFVGSLSRSEPKPADEAWARAALLPGEAMLWEQMSAPDRRHAIGVARQVAQTLGERASRPVLAAALLHDVGKVELGWGPFRRAGATLIAVLAGYGRAREWRDAAGVRGHVGRYVCHDEIGDELLDHAGSDELTVAWARQHHLPPERWTVPAEVGAALKAADDD